jgi:hypothetical protein
LLFFKNFQSFEVLRGKKKPRNKGERYGITEAGLRIVMKKLQFSSLQSLLKSSQFGLFLAAKTGY